jgi:cephalosporin-C deacetylase
MHRSAPDQRLAFLSSVAPPEIPPDFAAFWQQRYQDVLHKKPLPAIRHAGRRDAGKRHAGKRQAGFEVFDLAYESTNSVTIRGWLLLPVDAPVRRVIVVGHGYGGCEGPSDWLPLADAAYLFPCYRGISRSRMPGLPESPFDHVLHGIARKEQYILGGCVEDTWMAVSAAGCLFPAARDHIGFMGISFSGGIGALAAPWDPRIRLAHFEVPSFGHHPLRMTLPSAGSAAAVQQFHLQHPEIMETLRYHDAAVAARFMDIPVHIAAALVDAFVAPEGQFAIFNALPKDGHLFVLAQGHAEYSTQASEQLALQSRLEEFFLPL